MSKIKKIKLFVRLIIVSYIFASLLLMISFRFDMSLMIDHHPCIFVPFIPGILIVSTALIILIFLSPVILCLPFVAAVVGIAMLWEWCCKETKEVSE